MNQSKNLKNVCNEDLDIPSELMDEDVYEVLHIFQNEEEAINYIVNEYNVDREKFISELHEDDYMREEYGKENYPRSASVNNIFHLTELMNGQYVLWESY